MTDLSQAACLSDGEMWFSLDPRDIAVAVSVCNSCPVRDACLEQALRAEGQFPSGQRYGVAGGLTPSQRARLTGRVRHRRTEVTRAPEQHGTPAGYRQHERKGSPKCPECIEAYAVVRRAERAEHGHDKAKRRARYLRSKAVAA